MASRPTRIYATKLYPNLAKTKGRQKDKENDVRLDKVILTQEKNGTNIVKHTGTKQSPSNSQPANGQTANVTSDKGPKTHNGFDRQPSSKTSKDSTISSGKVNLSAKSKASSYLIRSEKIKEPISASPVDKGTAKTSTKMDNDASIKNNKGSGKKPEVLKGNVIGKPIHQPDTEPSVTHMSQNGNPDRASKASKMTSETSKQPLFSKERIVVPKATQLHDKTKHKKTITQTTVMLMNVKGHDDKNGSILERRRHVVQNVIQKYLPALVLIQDFKLPDISSKFWSTHPLPTPYTYTGDEDLGLMYDQTLIDVQDIPVTEFQNTLQGLQRHSNNKLKRTVPVEFDPFPRMCARVIKSKRGPPLHFIAISWHGRFNCSGGGRLKHAQKLEYFEYLMEFLRIVREKVKLPILIGGNFNVDMYSVEHLVHTPFQLCIYDASMRRTVPGIVDYYIITEDLQLTEISWVSLREETTAYQPNGVMDHDPVRAFITGKPKKGAGSKGMVNPQKWQPSRGKGTSK